MSSVLWSLPVPATALTRGPFLKVLPRRQCEISFSIEADNSSETTTTLLFQGVEAFKCTYLTSLGTIDPQLFRDAYGKLIRLTDSPWLAEIKNACRAYHAKGPAQPNEICHLMIGFDDGPYYEFVCESFERR